VWEDHLLPLVTSKEAAQLVCTCKALRGGMREHFCGDLGKVKLSKLQEALTTFSRARSVEPYHVHPCLRRQIGRDPNTVWGDAERWALVEWLLEGGEHDDENVGWR
jgi:hypothetical protein